MPSTIHIHIRGVKHSGERKEYIVEYYHGSSTGGINWGTHMGEGEYSGFPEAIAHAKRLAAKAHKGDHPVRIKIHNCGKKDGEFHFSSGKFVRIK